MLYPEHIAPLVCISELTHLTGNYYHLQYDAGLFLESLSVELVVLAIWKKSLQICSSWLSATTEGELPATSSTNDSIPLAGAGTSSNSGKHIDFSKPSSVSLWAKQGFLSAFDRAEKSSSHIRDMDG